MFKFIKRFFAIILRWAPIYIKYLFYFVELHLFHRELLRQDIWLICEKRGEARDNGYHLFRYIRENHPEVNAYYVITDNSPDRKKVEQYGNLISNDSSEHFLYYLAAKYSINSQCSGAYPAKMIPEFFNLTRCFRRKDQKCVFLQHGITMNYITQKDLFYSSRVVDLFSTTLEREHAFVEKEYGYPSGIIRKIGFCRFDSLYNSCRNTKKQILVMPTWRKWLNHSAQFSIDPKLIETFSSSDFYKNYFDLLTSKKLIYVLKKYGYRLVFYPHYAFQGYLPAFENAKSEFVALASSADYDVQALLIESSVLITDYSSVFFDFAYMGKPEIFFQFDSNEFAANHYKRGYFDYASDAFGLVARSADQVIDELEKILSNDCVMEEPYASRCKKEFAFIDNMNCERTFNAISELGGIER